MSDISSLEARIRRIEDRTAIQDLVIMYGFLMDERDVDHIPRLFTSDGTLRSQDGVFAASGIDAIVKTYQGRFAALGATNHVSHGHVVVFDDEQPDHAKGLVAGHAEVVRDGVAMLVALRYKDEYRRTSVGWQLQDRLMSYMYYAPAAEYTTMLTEANRTRAYGDQRIADWPETLVEGGDISWLRTYLP